MDDLWDNCFEPAMEMAPQVFTNTFCKVCRNTSCERSAINSTKWMRRVASQVDHLLINPTFGDPNDPKYRDMVDFPSVLQEAMRLEISDRKGDWNIPTAVDAQEFVAQMVPPPEARVDTPPPEADDVDEPVIIHTQQIRGASESYTVNLTTGDDGPVWSCTCKGYVFGRSRPCKHITYVQSNYDQNRPTPSQFTQETPADPGPAVEAPLSRAPFLPPRGNTAQSGSMVGGVSPSPKDRVAAPPPIKPTPSSDPWAIPTKADNIIPVGGKVVLGRKP